MLAQSLPETIITTFWRKDHSLKSSNPCVRGKLDLSMQKKKM